VDFAAAIRAIFAVDRAAGHQLEHGRRKRQGTSTILVALLLERILSFFY
jgi:hypothetical protein